MTPSSAAAPDAALSPTPRRPRARLLAVVVLAAAIGPVGLASAAPFVGPFVDAAPADTGIQSPRAAVGADGTVTVVWRRFNVGQDTIQAATRPAGESDFEAPEIISSPGWMYEPQVAVDGSGATIAVWQHWNGVLSTIEAARRPPGAGSFSAPVTISTPGQGADYQDTAVSADGDITVAWPSWNGSAYAVQTATLTSGSSTFSAPETISATDVNRPVHVAIGPSGRTTIAWSTGTNVQTATREAGAPTFSAAVTVPETSNIVSLPRVIEGADGATTVAWRRTDGYDYIIRAARRAPGAGGYSPSDDLSAYGESAGTPHLAEDASGALAIAWLRSDGTSERVQAVTRPAGSSAFSAPEYVSPAGSAAGAFDLAADGSGTLLAWSRVDGAGAVLQASARPAGSATFSAPVDVTSSGSGFSLGHVPLQADGDGAFVVQSSGGATSTIRVADLDGAASALAGVSIGTTAIAGQPVEMSTDVAADTWAALAPAPVWDFGDGSPAAVGAEVAHVYAAAGTYPLTIARSNVLGHTDSFTIHLTVAEAPASSTPDPPSAPPVAPSPAPRAVPLTAQMRLVRSDGRLVVRVSGRAGAAEAGRRVLVERVARGRTVRVCALTVSARGAFAGRCRLGRAVRGQGPDMRLRVRLPAAAGVRGARTKAVLLRS